MSRPVLFQMTEPIRQSLIDQHLFYVGQARVRLLVQFPELEVSENAELFIEGWMKYNEYRFNPSFHDGGDFYTEACEHYQALLDLGNQTRLSVVAGMYHEWEKQLRQWLVGEFSRWHDRDQVLKTIWDLNFHQVVELLKSAQWDINDQNYYRLLNLCRLIVNVYKHGKGPALNELLKQHPEYLSKPFDTTPLSPDDASFNSYFPIHTYLKVPDEQIQKFSAAIVAFWQAVPKDIFDYDEEAMPNKIKNALKMDNRKKNTQQGGLHDK